MSTQQDIYDAGFENHTPMLNKGNYVPWSSCLLCYAKSKQNGNLIYNFIMNGPYVRRLIPEPGDPDRKQMMNDYDIGIQDEKAKLFNEWKRFTSTNGESIESYYHRFLKLMNDFKRNKCFPENITSNLKFLNNIQLEWRRHVTIVHQTKDLHDVDYTQLYDFFKYNQAELNELRAERLARAHDPMALMAHSNNPYNYPVQIAQPGIDLGQDRHMQMVRGNEGISLDSMLNVRNLNGLIVVSSIANQNVNQSRNGNVVAAQAEEDLEEIEKVNAKCIWMANLQQASTSEADESLAKHKTLEYEIERLLKAVVSQDIMSIMQSNSIVDTSNLHTELERTKERFENCIIKNETEYAKLWNDWYKKCEEYKYEKISYDKAYNDMQQKIERLQAELGNFKGKSQDTPCVSDTLDPLCRKLKNENVILDFQILNYAKENEHLKTTYKNLFDSINVTLAQTKTITDSLQQKLHDTIYENSKQRAQLFDKVSGQKDSTKGMSMNTKFSNQSIMGKPSLRSLRNNFVVRQPNEFQSERQKNSKVRVPRKVVETNDLSNPVTLNSVPITKESKVVKNDNVIAPEMFRINPSKTSREDKFVPINQARASVKTNLITVSQPHVITKKDVNSYSKGLSSTGVAKTKKPQSRSNTKNDRVPFVSKSSCIKNTEVEEHHRNLMLSKNKKNVSSECNNIKLAIQNDKSKVVCAMCKQCLITFNHDVCVLKYVNAMNSCGDKHSTNVLKTTNKRKYKPKGKKPKKVGSKEILASPKPRKPRTCLRSKDEAPEEIKTFIKKIAVLLQAPVIIVITDNGTKFKNKVLKEHFDSVGISHQASSTPHWQETNSSSQDADIPNTSHDVGELEPEQQHVQQQDDQSQLQIETVANNVPNTMLDGNVFVNLFAQTSTHSVIIP
nr:integrase, catalytic region, zinc finger, CCHC-type, peptidase aspartic, catalytic [Tanacetum cinerariifolium]